MRLYLAGFFALLGTFMASAQQQPVKPAPTSAVTGHVFLSDTNGPARLATVVLEPTSAIDGYQADTKNGVSEHMNGISTLPDGSFAFTHVAPGSYYIHATAPGYVSSLDALGYSGEELTHPTKEIKERIRAAVPRVVVQANLSATADVVLERGAAVGGTVLYDDGSPAAGLTVRLLIHNKDKWVEPQLGTARYSPPVKTDDRGAYRISGLPAEEYLVKVELHLERTSIETDGRGTYTNNGDGGTTVPVYGGNALRQKDAAPFRLKLGEERPGEDVQIPLGKLHSVAGTILAPDGHTVNGGTVTLVYTDDKSEAVHNYLSRDDSGFSMSFVPEGDYIARVTGAADLEYTDVPNGPGMMPATRSESRTVHSYGTGEQPLHVGSGDITGLALTVPEQKRKGTQ